MPSVSKKQQKFMGIVRSIQKGEAPAGKFSKDAQDAAKKMKKSSVKKYAKTKHDDLPTKKEGVQKDRNELSLHIIDLNNMLGQARLSRNPKAKKYIKLIQKDLKDARKKLSKLKEERDYKAEYKKFQSSTKAKKYRAELNKYNRQKGTYGNGDGKDASHKGGKIVGFEKESVNRGRAEKSRLKKEANMPDFNPMIDKALDEVIEEYTMARTPVIDKIAKLAKANKYGDVDGTKMNGKTAKQIIAIYNHPKMKRFKNAMKNYTADQFSDLTIKLPKVLGIKENDMNEGNPLELGKLKDAIKMFQKKIKKQGRVTNARDEEHLKRLMKIYNDMGGKKIKENNELYEWLYEACWKGYEKKGMKKMFGKMYPNCVKKTKKEGIGDKFAKKINKHGGTQVKGEMGKGVQKILKIADSGYGKVGGTTVDGMSANLFKQLYDKANDDIKQKLNKKSEKQLVMIIGRMWKKFGKNVTIGSSV